MIYKAFSNIRYALANGETSPELLMSCRYRGGSLRKARLAILPLGEGCEGFICKVVRRWDQTLEQYRWDQK